MIIVSIFPSPPECPLATRAACSKQKAAHHHAIITTSPIKVSHDLTFRVCAKELLIGYHQLLIKRIKRNQSHNKHGDLRFSVILAHYKSRAAIGEQRKYGERIRVRKLEKE